jgi:hypothetical protein
MENKAGQVLLFTLLVFFTLIIISLADDFFHLDEKSVGNINLISDIIKTKEDKTQKDTSILPLSKAVIRENTGKVDSVSAPRNFELFSQPLLINEFRSDSSYPSLLISMKKLHALKRTGKGKFRIAYFGDSMIEGDLLTQTIRKLLQAEFGGKGVGFVPVYSPVSKFRQTASVTSSGGWADENFKSKTNTRLYLSGHAYFGSPKDFIYVKDNTIRDFRGNTSKSILYGVTSSSLSLAVNKEYINIPSGGVFNKAILKNDNNKDIAISNFSNALPIFGVTIESEDGVVLDNFSFRGITGIELKNLDTAFLKEVSLRNHYDLVVFQYGVNMLYRPQDKEFDWYKRAFDPVIKKFRKCFADAELLIVSSADRAFRYENGYESAVGMEPLVEMQAGMAYDNQIAFYNQFQSMGGRNAIVRWADSSIALANKDYIHPNHRGAEKLGELFFLAFMKEYKKAEKFFKEKSTTDAHR